MPRKKTKGKTKKGHAKRRTKRSVATFQGAGSAFPANRTVKMRYCQYVELQPTVAGIQTYRFRANGCFDPNYTGTGHQPMGFDEWSMFYNHYRVLSSKITATCVNGAVAAANGAYAFGAYLSDDATTPTTWEHYAELKKGTQKVIAPNMNRMTSVGTRFNAVKFFSKNMDKGDTNAPITADPAEQAIYNIYVQPLDQLTTAAANAQIKVMIEYTVSFFEPKDLTQS